MTDVVIVGAGGHGREVLEVLRDQELQWGLVEGEHPGKVRFAGFVDDAHPDAVCTVAEMGSLPEGTRYVIGVGSGVARERIDDAATAAGLSPVTLIHSTATVGDDSTLGDGCVVFAQATVTSGVRLGRHTHVSRGAAVGHDCRVGDYVTVMPLASVSGNVTIGDRSTIGTGAAVRQGQHIGSDVMVGAGAAVVSDVESATTAVGVPATTAARSASRGP